MSRCPLTVVEARAILVADDSIARAFASETLGGEELDAWRSLVASAKARIAESPNAVAADSLPSSPSSPYPGGNEPDFQTLFLEAVASHRDRKGYTIKRLTADDAGHVAELLRVSIADKHYLDWHPKLREIREKMIERLGDLSDQERRP